MTTADCKVVFRGQIEPGQSETDVRAALSARLRLSPQRVDALFTGKPVIIKRDIDAATAEKIRRTFAEAGAICEVIGANTSESAQAESDPPSRPAANDGPETAASARTPDASATAEAQQDNGQEESGDDPNQTIVNLPVPSDLGDLALAGDEAYSGPRDDTPAPEIDTSELAVVDDGGPLEPPDETTKAPVIDISDLELAPAADSPQQRR